MSSPATDTSEPRRTSLIHFPGEPDDTWTWAFPDASSSLIIFPPPPEPHLPQADAQSALLAVGDYLDASLEALDAGDVATLLHNLAVLQSIAGVIADRFGRASSEYAGNARALQ